MDLEERWKKSGITRPMIDKSENQALLASFIALMSVMELSSFLIGKKYEQGSTDHQPLSEFLFKVIKKQANGESRIHLDFRYESERLSSL